MIPNDSGAGYAKNKTVGRDNFPVSLHLKARNGSPFSSPPPNHRSPAREASLCSTKARFPPRQIHLDALPRAARGARGDAGPPTGGEAASSPPAPPRCRAPSASALGREPVPAPAPAPLRRRRPPGRPAAPPPRRPAPRWSGPRDSGPAVSWQERVPSVLASPAPFELVAAALLACAWLLEGEKEEGGTDGWGKGEKSSLELYLCSLGASDSAARELLSLLFPFRVHGEEKVSMQLSPGARLARYVLRARRVLRGSRCCCRHGGGGCQLLGSVTVTLHLS
ncbi:formin-like protein 18 [Rhinopithecus roxellana]|uniref:formin-like protein 18 n=1 Tax=Rhinopithecus roxellana TaxID=61622 RepID=UPI001237330F|nr:formin-like protein 18 [Rhinopithecus roxellana]